MCNVGIGFGEYLYFFLDHSVRQSAWVHYYYLGIWRTHKGTINVGGIMVNLCFGRTILGALVRNSAQAQLFWWHNVSTINVRGIMGDLCFGIVILEALYGHYYCLGQSDYHNFGKLFGCFVFLALWDTL